MDVLESRKRGYLAPGPRQDAHFMGQPKISAGNRLGSPSMGRSASGSELSTLAKQSTHFDRQCIGNKCASGIELPSIGKYPSGFELRTIGKYASGCNLPLVGKYPSGIELSSTDKYTAGIELSNACRNYYTRRLRVAEGVKRKLGLPATSMAVKGEEEDIDEGYKTQKPQRRTTSIDKAMDKLRKELASLIDQDLTLMKQLLTLNEQIEELKWQRKLSGYTADISKGSSMDSSSNFLDSSACTLESEPGPDLAASRDGLKYPSPSLLSILSGCKSSHEFTSFGGSQPLHRCSTLEENDTSTSDLGSSTEMTNSANSLKRSKYNTDTLNSTLTNSSQEANDGSTEIDDDDTKTDYEEYEDKFDIKEEIEDTKEEVLQLLDKDHGVYSQVHVFKGDSHKQDISCTDALKAFDMVLEGLGDEDYEEEDDDCSWRIKTDVDNNNERECDLDNANDLEICIPPPCFGETDDESDTERLTGQLSNSLSLRETTRNTFIQ